MSRLRSHQYFKAILLMSIVALSASPLMSQTEDQYIAGVNTAIVNLTSTLGPATQPIVFGGNLVHANGQAIAQANLSNLLAYADGLKAAGIQQIELNPSLTFLGNATLTAMYDALIQHIRQLGL